MWEVIGGRRALLGRTQQHVCRRSIPSVRFEAVRGGPFGFPSGERRADRRLARLHRASVDFLLAKGDGHHLVFHWMSARGLSWSEPSNIGTRTWRIRDHITDLLVRCFGSDFGRACGVGKSTTGHAIRDRAMHLASSFSGEVGCSVVLFPRLAVDGRALSDSDWEDPSRAETLDARCNWSICMAEDPRRRFCVG